MAVACRLTGGITLGHVWVTTGHVTGQRSTKSTVGVYKIRSIVHNQPPPSAFQPGRQARTVRP